MRLTVSLVVESNLAIASSSLYGPISLIALLTFSHASDQSGASPDVTPTAADLMSAIDGGHVSVMTHFVIASCATS